MVDDPYAPLRASMQPPVGALGAVSDVIVQSSFNSGEWAPALNARVDIQKYHSGAALLENFFVDYRGGASTRTGTAYVIQAFKSSTAVRVIPFQASFNIGYCLEFGDRYIRPLFEGAPVLEPSFPVTAATQANPCVVTVTSPNFNAGDWIFLSAITGMTQLNGRYFSISSIAGNLVTLADLNGVAINSTTYGAYISGGAAARIYIFGSPYAASDLELVKFAQNIDTMILTHPNYPMQILTLNSATNWTITAVVIGSTVPAPTGLSVTTTLGAGSTNYSYVVTAIDQKGQESEPSVPSSLTSKLDIRSNAGSNSITWSTTPGAIAYNVYESSVSYFGVVPSGVEYGFIGTCTSPNFIDSNIGPDFSQSPPVQKNPFVGGLLTGILVTATGVYTSVPTASLSGGIPVVSATIAATLGIGSGLINGSNNGWSVGDAAQFPYGVVLIVATVNGVGAITSFQPLTYPGTSRGSISSGAVPTNPVNVLNDKSGSGHTSANFSWGVFVVNIVTAGFGYTSAPTVSFSPAGATATASISAIGGTNPAVPAFFQQRLVFASTPNLPQTFWMSKPGLYYNFDVSQIAEPDDSITGTLVSGVLNTIKSIVTAASGMLVLTDKNAWIVNGGSGGGPTSPGAAVSPANIVANPQSYVGANDVPPIIANYDILYIQSKGSGVRDLAFNIYWNVFTGTDISTLSSHLFFNHKILEWAWANFPFYVVWAIREDGVMLSLTYLKEQDFTAWAQHNTSPGLFKSVAAVTESTATAGNVDAVYVVVQRLVNGNTVQYIERMAERTFPNGLTSAWAVDAGIQYSGPATSTFSGAENLAGLTVTGLADGVLITPFVMPLSGIFTLGIPASVVTIGLGFTCQLQTLAIDVGAPSIQGKVKKIPFVDVRVADTLGLTIGGDFSSQVVMKDLVLGNVSSMRSGKLNQTVTGLVTGDARTFLDPSYTVQGQYAIRQSNPYPATVLGVFPSLVIGDTK